MNELESIKIKRTDRLLKIQLILWQYPDGIKVNEIARKCDVSARTIYRDIGVLESEFGVPIWEEAAKIRILDGYFLPPIKFTLEEAISIFLAIHSIRHLSPRSNTSIISTFQKLNTIVPKNLKKHIDDIIEYMLDQPRNEEQINNFNKLINAWLSHHQVRIHYSYNNQIVKQVVQPYYIAHSLQINSTYVIAFSCLTKDVIDINLDHIIGDVIIEPETYEIPSDFDIMNYLDSSWEICRKTENIETIKLHFKFNDCKALMAIQWHPSQKIEVCNDGTIVMTLRTRMTEGFFSWVLGWGENVEVIEPESLRKHIIESNKSSLEMYANKIPYKDITDDQWALINTILPPQAKTGRPKSDERQNINGILWVLRTGEKWADVPRRYGSHSSCHSKYQTWKANGIWNKILQILHLK